MADSKLTITHAIKAKIHSCGRAGQGALLVICLHAGITPPKPSPIPPGQLSGSMSAAAAAATSIFSTAAGAATEAASLGPAFAGAAGANACVVRCAQQTRDPAAGCRALDGEQLSLYVELNVAFRLTAEDAAVVTNSEKVVSWLVVVSHAVCWTTSVLPYIHGLLRLLHKRPAPASYACPCKQFV
jgi:hypothetical protein